MKLRNKQTGEIVPASNVAVGIGEDGKWYDSLAILNEEWEDYEEQKGHWFINDFGTPTEILHARENIYDKCRKNFGNYFSSKEEAEKAVKKLKAFKRLKDKGFEFEWIDKEIGSIKFAFFNREGKITKEMWEDLHICFGGEE